MSTVVRIAKQASGHCRRTLGAALAPLRSAEAEVHHLHEIELEGESGATPFIAVLGLILFFLLVFLVMMGLAFTAYYLA